MIKGQLQLFSTEDNAENLLERYVDYSDLGKTQAMERDLELLVGFIEDASLLPMLKSYLIEISERSNV